MAEEMTRHRAVFGLVPRTEVWSVLDRHLQGELDSGLGRVLFEAGAIGAVFGVQLADGREVVVKAYQPSSDLPRLGAMTECQALLQRRGFPCAAVLSPPRVVAGAPMVIEELLRPISTGSPHEPEEVDGMAAGLARQIELLADVNAEALNRGRPAWSNWEVGAWPVPHDPIFDFAVPARGYEWLDDRANAHADVLRQLSGLLPNVVGHTDWVWQNVAVRDGRLAAAYDWDSLAFLPEAAILGLSAGAYSQGSPIPPDAPPWQQVTSFVDAYIRARGRGFSLAEEVVVENAAGWVRCYNARCQIDNLQRRDAAPPDGSFVDMITADAVRPVR